MAIIYHLIQRADWESAKLAPEYRPESLAAEGFIHCSQDEAQMLEVASRRFSGRDDMLVLDVETTHLTSPVKYERSRSGGLYPHIYGPMNISAVRRVRLLATDANGKFFIVTSGFGLQAPDRGDKMSTFEWPIEVGTPEGDYFEVIAVLVDTGSSLTFVPREMLERLGVQPTEREEFELANGRIEVREVGETRVRLEGRVLTRKVGFGEPGDASVLGSDSLEGAGLAVDPVNQRLIRVRRRWL